ncbi:MAG: metal-dependent transcriptional regulator [Firmicutes bacterium]|nr:metal-dependent transcriptional regulator [Bacillota bacterium]
MNERKAKVSASLEDYLEAIYFLHIKTPAVRVTDLALKLEISKPSVIKAIKILKERGYVDHEPYGALKLTEQGVALAQNIAGRHMVLKKFLCNVLGVSEDVADEEACLIEHCLSPDTIRRIREYTENHSLSAENIQKESEKISETIE